jgi:uncharacterized protein YndB with AHSA1/START domain
VAQNNQLQIAIGIKLGNDRENAMPRTTHSTFVIERSFNSPPETVFNAFADPKAKEQWFSAPSDQCKTEKREMDFRVGGSETVVGRWNNGMVSDFRARYHDIVPNQRIVQSYEMRVNGAMISVSLATTELKPHGKGTKLIFTEQDTFLDFDDAGGREHGSIELIDNLVRVIDGK